MSSTWREKRALPSNWRKIRVRVLRRDGGRCQIAGPSCLGAASEVDHIGHRDDHRLVNLRSVCKPCHRLRTADQARDAIATIQARKYRVEKHPGMVVE